MNRPAQILLTVLLAIDVILIAWVIFMSPDGEQNLAEVFRNVRGVPAARVRSPFFYNFDFPGMVLETGAMDESKNSYWWVNSGGGLIFKGSVGATFAGELSRFNWWRLVYNHNNPDDTDRGYHPQNIFRLVARSKWQNSQTEIYFKILADNLSQSPNRNESNGLLLFNRYQDGNNLYYAGLRVDGHAVIKKKINGQYFTLSEKEIFPGVYDRELNPNLLPKNIWLGIRNEVLNTQGDTVAIKLYLDQEMTGDWELILEATDDGRSFGGRVITDSGYTGVCTDFMDVLFDDFSVKIVPNE